MSLTGFVAWEMMAAIYIGLFLNKRWWKFYSWSYLAKLFRNGQSKQKTLSSERHVFNLLFHQPPHLSRTRMDLNKERMGHWWMAKGLLFQSFSVLTWQGYFGLNTNPVRKRNAALFFFWRCLQPSLGSLINTSGLQRDYGLQWSPILVICLFSSTFFWKMDKYVAIWEQSIGTQLSVQSTQQ